MSRLLVVTTLCTLLSLFIFSCGKDDEPSIPPQGYIVFNNTDTVHFNHLVATKDYFTPASDSFVLAVNAGNYPNGDISQTPNTFVQFYINTKVQKGVFNDKRCFKCYNNPVLNVLNNGVDYTSEDCYIDTNTFNTFTAELFYNKKANAETVVFNGTLCKPTSDTTFTTIKVKGVMQDAPFK